MKTKIALKHTKQTYYLLGAISLLVLSIVSLLALFFWNDPPAEDVQELKMDLTIGDHLGVNLDNDAIHFGTVEQGKSYSLAREVVLSNNDARSQRLSLSTEGELAQWLTLSERAVTLLPQQNKTITVTLKVPANLELGTYNGMFKAAKNYPSRISRFFSNFK
ncbi:MAG: hypothetical protein AB1668_02360 [Nanoarchaeota archaeon]